MKADKYQTIRHTLDPVYNRDSKLLILGSFPSVKTREHNFYYGHPQNRFWKVLAELFQVDIGSSPAAKEDFLLDHQIALYDVIYQCDIVGSSDASIKNVVPTNLSPIFETGQIRQVYLGGGTALKYYKRYQAEKTGMPGLQLPSTSPANARYRLDDLVEAWSVILQTLEGD